MSDELQAEVVVPVETENLGTSVPSEPPEKESESATDTGATPEEKIVFSEEQQKIVDDIAAKKTFKIREAERESDKLRKQLEEAQAKIPKDIKPEIPPIPDRFDLDDDEYVAKLKERDEAIRKAVEFDTSQAAVTAQKEADTQAQLDEQQKALDESVKTYADTANKLGISPQNLQAAEQTIVEFGIDGQIANYILADEHGPLITTYLSENLVELDALNRMNPMNAAVRIAEIVKPKATASLGVKPPTTPDPVETLSGSGVKPTREGLEGVTYS